MRTIVLSKDTVYNGTPHLKGEVIQVDDGVVPVNIKLKNTFDESCIKRVLAGKPLEVKKEKEEKDGKTK